MISPQFISRVCLRRDIVDSFERYPFCLLAVRTLDAIAMHPKVTFLVGENGSGKTTLMEAIAVLRVLLDGEPGEAKEPT